MAGLGSYTGTARGGVGGVGGSDASGVPWWGDASRPGQGGAAYNNRRANAPAGYTFDAVKGDYVPTVGSAEDAASNETRVHGIQDKLLGMMDGLNGAAIGSLKGADGYSTGVAGAPHVDMQPGNLSSIPDASAAQSAAFGQAKAKAGAMGRSSLESMRAELANRGNLGGGTEARGLVDRLAAATNPLSDVNVSQQNDNLGIIQHNQDQANANATTKYSGEISQRDQDIQAQNAAANRELAARGQKLSLLQGVLSGLTGRVSVGMGF